MAFGRLSAWFLTESGKNFSYFTATTACLGVFCAKVFPNTFLLDNYKDIVHLYKSGISVQLSATLKDRFRKALELTNLPENEQMLYKPFSVYGFDIFSAGSVYSRFGCIIGLPVNFTYTDVDSVDKHTIRINNESVPWDLAEGKQLLNSLVLSEKAQLYAMAREILMTKSAQLILDTLYGTICTFSCITISIYFNRKLNLLKRPVGFRLFLYTLAALFSYGNYVFLKDFTQLYYEEQVDKYLKDKDPIFTEGGKEFYAKLLSRNQALRTLMGKVGETKYSVLGNEIYLLRQRHLPIIQRKEFFEYN